MPTCGFDCAPTPRRKKVWRYPGVPIPWRLQGKYFDPTMEKKGENHA
ncbi:MAG TPA: hypothetical protein VG501_10135 [Rhizomicrobium sp.]|nr:hypothetical protein [Rhizomicrobium sp.]